MAFELAKAYVSVEARNNRLKPQLDSSVSQFRSAVGKMQGALAGLGVAVGVTALIAQISKLKDESIELFKIQEQAERRLQAVLRATGQVVGFTSKELQRFASHLQSVTTTGDEAILNIMAKLATFRNVQRDIFKEGTELALDLAATGFGSAEQAAVMLGKALEDPILGMSALRRVGVSFNAEQVMQIKNLIEMNRLYAAQEKLLEAVKIQVGGVAREQAKTAGGRIQQLETEIGDLKEQLGKRAIPLRIGTKEVTRDVLEATGFWTEFLAEQNAAIRESFEQTRPLAERNEMGDVVRALTAFWAGTGGLARRFRESRTFGFGEEVGRPFSEEERRVMEQERARIGLGAIRALPQTLQPIEHFWGNFRRSMRAGVESVERDVLPTMKDVWRHMSLMAEGWRNERQLLEMQGRWLIQSFLPALRFGIKSLIPDFRPFAAKRDDRRTPRSEMQQWGRFMGFEDINRTMQEAFLAEEDPAKETNQILDKQGRQIWTPMKRGIDAINTILSRTPLGPAAAGTQIVLNMARN